MSPLTTSYFNCWAFFDACTGPAVDTICTTILEVGAAFGMHADLLPLCVSCRIDNTPPTLFYGPWLWTVDLSLAMTTRIRERVTLEMRVETFNTFNHFNPSNPNTSLTLNPASGANTNAAFGTIQSAQVQARHVALSARIRF